MAVTHIQDVYRASGGAASVSVPLSALGSGNTLVASVFLPAGTSASTVTDNLGNRWIQAAYSHNSTATAAETRSSSTIS